MVFNGYFWSDKIWSGEWSSFQRPFCCFGDFLGGCVYDLFTGDGNGLKGGIWWFDERLDGSAETPKPHGFQSPYGETMVKGGETTDDTMTGGA